MTLGLVASGKRTITSGKEYEKYFTEKTEGNEVELLADGDVYDTLKLMKKVVDKTLPQTKAISKVLKGDSLEATCRNIWNFLYYNVQYKKDHPLREQLRTPARTWKDRKNGVDCDCYSIFISSVLTNLGIKHAFRMAAYKGDFQHVYVVVPKGNKSEFFIIDPVVDTFNYEAPYSKKHDAMTRVSMLNGLGACDTTPEILRLRHFVPTQQVIAEGKVPTREFLISNGIPFAPAFDEASGSSVYIAQIKGGNMQLPTVLTKAQADQVLVAKPDPTDAPGQTTDCKKKPFPWIWVAIGAATLIILTGDDQDEVKTGLNGLGKTIRKAVKSTKKTLKTISI